MTSQKSKPRPPSHLGKHGKTFWNRVAAEYELLPQDLDRLEGACTMLDRAHAARAAIEESGVVTKDRFGCDREHPAIRVEASAWNSFRLLARELGLDIAPSDTRPASPPRGYR